MAGAWLDEGDAVGPEELERGEGRLVGTAEHVVGGEEVGCRVGEAEELGGFWWWEERREVVAFVADSAVHHSPGQGFEA